MSANHQFDPTILREYDIRGIVGDTLTEDDARAIGRTFGTIVRRAGGTRVCIGYDGRLSSPMMEAAVVEGLCAAGVDVDRVGMGPTPMLYFAVRSTEADGGVMITGSHNPPDYNGFKMMIGKKSFFGQDIQKLGRMAAAGDWESGSGSARATPMLDAYVDRIAADYDGTKDLTVVWDAGNGSAGEAMKMLTAKLPGTHHLLFADIDGQFPNHHPDPTVEKNLADLKAKVAETKADLGIAFDGDGDRIGVVDNQGRILWGDQLMVLWSRDVLAKHPGATVIADVKASQVLFDEIAKAGGQPQMGRTGHSLIKAAMAETGAPLAGEMSGHIFFADHYYGFDDALYAAVRLLGVISRSDQTIGEIRDGLPHMVNTPEIRFQCPEDRKFKVATEVKERLAGTDVDVNDIDGVRVTTADGWWLLRASNTQDVLVARCEAHDEAGLEKLKGLLREQLVASGITPPEM